MQIATAITVLNGSIGSTCDGSISLLGRRREADTELVVLTASGGDEAGSNFVESSRITPGAAAGGDHVCSRQAEEHFLAADCKLAVLVRTA